MTSKHHRAALAILTACFLNACATEFSLTPPVAPAALPIVVDVDAVRAAADTSDAVTFETIAETAHSTTAVVTIHGQVPPHVHVHSDEAIYVLSGRGELLLDAVWQEVEAGAWIHVPQGLPHAYVNRAPGGSVVLVTYTPRFVEGDRVPIDYAR